MYSKIIVFFSILVLSSCSSSKWMVGEWEGVGKQIDGQKWDVDLTVSKNNEINIQYPTLTCGGTWIPVSSEKEEVIFTEKIETGRLHCDQGVEVHVIKQEEGMIKIEYFIRTYNANDLIAVAEMTRK